MKNDILVFIQTGKPGVTDEDIKSAEEKLGAVFPEVYKEFYKLVNQAEIGEWILFPIKDPNHLRKSWDDIVRQNLEVRDENMPEDLIAIGDDGNGDKLCFQVINGKMSEKIYLWDHETNEIEEYAPNLIEFVKLESEAEEG